MGCTLDKLSQILMSYGYEVKLNPNGITRVFSKGPVVIGIYLSMATNKITMMAKIHSEILYLDEMFKSSYIEAELKEELLFELDVFS